jgi:hypothetical protein
VALKLNEILVVSQIWDPKLFIAEFTGPLTAAEPGQAPYATAAWTLAQASVRGTPDKPDRASIVVDDLKLADAPGTPLFDAINMMGRELQALNPPRCSIVIITDGDENGSRHTTADQARAILDWCRAQGWQVTFLGADFVQEGKWAGEWAVKQYASAPGPVNIVQLEGTTGSDPALERTTGFANAIAANPNLKVIATQSGDFTRSGGKQVMEAFLKANPKIDMVFAQNDDMGLGAMDAIEAAGLKPGQDIKIVAIDATHDGMQALADGKINYIVECNPLLGPQLMLLAQKVKAGEVVPPRVETKETAFDQAAAKTALPSRQY